MDTSVPRGCSAKGDPAEEEFNNQGHRMTHPLNSQPLPQPSLSVPNVPMNQVAMVAEMGLCMDSTTWVPFRNVDLAYRLPNLPAADIVIESPI